MYPLGLRRSQLREFKQALRSSHSMRVRVYVLNLDHERLADLSDELEDGQVNIDSTADVTRSATISFLDRARTFDFNSDSPGDGALYANRMLRIEYRVKVDSIGDWVEVPIFTGPIVSMDRAGDVVNVEAQGKESLAMGACWEPLTIKKGTPKVDAIKRIMRERGGESRFSLPDLKERLGHRVSLGRQSSPWSAANRIAESIDDGGRQLFYDGAGRLRLRHHPENDCYTFNDGNGGEVMTEPQVAFSTDNVANIVWVKGGKPKATQRKNETRAEFEARQAKERGVEDYVVAPHSHPLSPFWPHGLGRPDAPHYLLEVVENQHVRSKKAATARAQKLLNHRLTQAVDVTLDSLVVPHVEEGDKVRIETSSFSMSFYLRQTTIPLKHDGTQSIGYLKRASLRGRRPNRGRQHGKPHRGKQHKKGGGRK